MHVRFPVIFSIQETKSCDVFDLKLPGYVCHGGKSGFSLLKQFCTIKTQGRHEERCAAILFGTTLVMAVYAPDSSDDMVLYETFVLSVLRVLRERRRGGVKKFYFTGDVNVELGIIVTRFVSLLNHRLTIVSVGQLSCSVLVWSQSTNF